MSKPSKSICYLCGEAIESNLKNDPMELSMDHIPPKQFFPKQVRATQNLNLNLAPSHKTCNEDYKMDEEYFYHSLYPIIAINNPRMGSLCSQDIQRRSQKPQTCNIIQKILSTAVTKTEGGIHLPNGLSRFTLDGGRIERVAAKIARGILFSSTERYYEKQQITRIDFYTEPSEIIEPYKRALQLNPLAGVYPDVFAHSHINLQGNGFRLLLMLFWKAFMFCVIVEDATGENQM
jgi:hypothetical protein